jgi:hypothetical protein
MCNGSAACLPTPSCIVFSQRRSPASPRMAFLAPDMEQPTSQSYSAEGRVYADADRLSRSDQGERHPGRQCMHHKSTTSVVAADFIYAASSMFSIESARTKVPAKSLIVSVYIDCSTSTAGDWTTLSCSRLLSSRWGLSVSVRPSPSLCTVRLFYFLFRVERTCIKTRIMIEVHISSCHLFAKLVQVVNQFLCIIHLRFWSSSWVKHHHTLGTYYVNFVRGADLQHVMKIVVNSIMVQ